jgi:Flp pilus assembly protein protease CpaA
MTWLLIYVLTISLYDLRTRRIPNWSTIPVLLAGLIAHFPGHPFIWLVSFILIAAWACNWMGAGDSKLWIALFWALPVDLLSKALPIMFATFFLTGFSQILWRIVKRQKPNRTFSPGAWRTIPFIVLCCYVH